MRNYYIIEAIQEISITARMTTVITVLFRTSKVW